MLHVHYGSFLKIWHINPSSTFGHQRDFHKFRDVLVPVGSVERLEKPINFHEKGHDRAVCPPREK